MQNPNGSIHQLAAWTGFQTTIPGRERVLGFGIIDQTSQELVATTLCVQMKTGIKNTYWWYSARGPVFDPAKHENAGTQLIEEVTHYLKTNTKGIFWRFDPYFSGTDMIRLKQSLSIKLKPAIQNYQPTDTLILDLRKENEILLSEMKRAGRRGINAGKKHNVELVSVTGVEYSHMTTEKQNELLDEFWRLNNETTGRNKFSGHEKTYYHNFLTKLSAYAVLFFVEHDGQKLATAISTFCGDKAIYYFGASTSDVGLRKLKTPYALQWHMINYARERGCSSYDFLGIAPENEPNHAYAGITEFKLKFGGERHTYASGQEIALKPLLSRVYRLAKNLR